MELRRSFLSGSTLKIIALVTMFIDHFGAVVVQRTMTMPGFNHEFWNSIYLPIRYIGRVAFPIYCFLLVEGFLHTTDRKKYLSRMLLFALISEIPFNLGITGKWMDFNYQNVFWELAVGMLVMICLEKLEEKNRNPILQVFLRLLVLFGFALLAEGLNLDYGMNGIISIAALYVFSKNRILQLCIGAVSFCWEPVAPFAFLLIALYSGKRGRKIKYAFYIFYPAHLLAFYVLARLIGCQY